MKTLFVVLILTVLARADSIAPAYYSNNIPVNGPGGILNYVNRTDISGSGVTLSGGTFTFATNGILSIQAGPALTVMGTLTNVFFNPKTGLLQGRFSETIMLNSYFLETCHYRRGCSNVVGGMFYEQVDLKTHTLIAGRLVYSTAPEPSSLILMSTGFAALAGLRRKYAGKL